MVKKAENFSKERWIARLHLVPRARTAITLGASLEAKIESALSHRDADDTPHDYKSVRMGA
jgi:hypothetical protein